MQTILGLGMWHGEPPVASLTTNIKPTLQRNRRENARIKVQGYS